MLNAFFRMFQPLPAPKPHEPMWVSGPILADISPRFLEIGPAALRVEFMALSSTAKVPAYASEGAAGMDLSADIDASIEIGDHKLIPTNIAIKLPGADFEAQVRSRSGLALKKGIMVLNSPGTIDSDYTGGIGVILYNAGSERFTVRQGDRIAQLVFCPIYRAQLVEVSEFAKTKRGAGGFGSTGVSSPCVGAQ